MAKREIEIKTWLTRQEMVKYLEDLAACLAQGKVVLQRGGEFLEFCPAQSLELELEGVHKKGQQKISIEISWRQVVMEPTEEPLKISPDSPPPPPPPPPQAQPEPAEPQAQAPADAPAAQEQPAVLVEQADPAAAGQMTPRLAKEEAGKGKGHKPSGK